MDIIYYIYMDIQKMGKKNITLNQAMNILKSIKKTILLCDNDSKRFDKYKEYLTTSLDIQNMDSLSISMVSKLTKIIKDVLWKNLMYYFSPSETLVLSRALIWSKPLTLHNKRKKKDEWIKTVKNSIKVFNKLFCNYDCNVKELDLEMLYIVSKDAKNDELIWDEFSSNMLCPKLVYLYEFYLSINIHILNNERANKKLGKCRKMNYKFKVSSILNYIYLNRPRTYTNNWRKYINRAIVFSKMLRNEKVFQNVLN